MKDKLCIIWGGIGLLVGAAILPSYEEYLLVTLGGFMVLTAVFWKLNDIHEECRKLADRH